MTYEPYYEFQSIDVISCLKMLEQNLFYMETFCVFLEFFEHSHMKFMNEMSDKRGLTYIYANTWTSISSLYKSTLRIC